MAITLTNRHRHGVQALKSLWNAVAGEDIPAGSLVHIDDTDGLMYLADATTAKEAHGIMVQGSMPLVTEATQDNRESVLKAGERADVELFAVATPDVLFDVAERMAPLYLVADGEVSLVAPTVTGHIVQVVGFVSSRTSVHISLLEANRRFVVIS